jgi:hypothetical protein
MEESRLPAELEVVEHIQPWSKLRRSTAKRYPTGQGGASPHPDQSLETELTASGPIAAPESENIGTRED